MSFFVYVLTANGESRYVGYTSNLKNRLWSHVNDAKKGMDSHCCNWLRKVLAAGSYPQIEVIMELSTKEKACFYERVYIDAYLEDGHKLTNMTDGGEGGIPDEATRRKIGAHFAGRKFSEEHRKRISDGLNRHYLDPANREARGNATRGKHHSAETRRKIGESQIGKVIPQEQRDKLSISMTGRSLSEEHRASIGAGLLGGKRTPEQRATMKEAQQRHAASEAGRVRAEKCRQAMTGRKHTEETKQLLRKPKSEETKQKLREAALRRHARERGEQV